MRGVTIAYKMTAAISYLAPIQLF